MGFLFNQNTILAQALLFGPFILAPLCYIWAFCSQRHKLASFREFLFLFCKSSELRGAQNIYYSAFLLLLFDGFTVIFGLVCGILVFCPEFDGLADFWLSSLLIWVGMRLLSQSQHLMTALISIIFLCHPKWDERLHIVKWLNLTGLLLIMFWIPFILIFFISRFPFNIIIAIIGIHIYNFLLMLGIIVSCCLPATSSMAQQRKAIGFLSFLMYFAVCLPNTVFDILFMTSEEYLIQAVNALFIVNFYVILDTLMFYLVLKIEERDRNDNQSDCAITSV